MARKTRKHTKSTKGIYSIPELRRAFEHVEQAMDEMIRGKESKENMISQIRKEWMKVFHKTLDKSSADALITHRMESHRTPHFMKGGAAALAGAPVDQVTRAGVYLAPGGIPGPDGGLPTTGGGFGHYARYVDGGFVNPEMAYRYDPIQSQSSFPLSPRVGAGSNVFLIKGGKRVTKTRKHKTRGKTSEKTSGKTSGGAVIPASLHEAFTTRMVPSGTPPSNPLFDIEQMSRGAAVGGSPDQTQNAPHYRVGSAYPMAVNINV
jgi:hypothetical protein